MNVLRPSVTVVIVNWNGAKFIGQCLDALTRQSVLPQEVIVVDNASTDESLSIINRYPNVKLIALTHNSGFAHANNLAISQANKQSTWIALINPDAFADPTWLEELMNAALENPDFSVIGSQLVMDLDPNKLDGVGDVYHVSGRVWRSGHGRTRDSYSNERKEIFSACAAAALFNKQALVSAGGFDEDYFCYVEDVDLGFRLRLLGFRCLYEPKSIARHIGSGTSSGQHSDFAAYYGHRNIVWTFVKNMPGMLFWLFVPLHIAMNCLSVLYLCIRGQGRVALSAKRDAIVGLPSAWQKRKLIQKQRKASIGCIYFSLHKGLRADRN
jgi:GT2 family glycosyltransferase